MFRKDPNRHRSKERSKEGSRSSSGASGARRPSRASRRAKVGLPPEASSRFVLYVEGPRDRDILESWARRIEPSVARCIERNTVILGGRQPARAVRDFRKRGGEEAGWTGLVVLDRDDHPEQELIAASEPNASDILVNPEGDDANRSQAEALNRTTALNQAAALNQATAPNVASEEGLGGLELFVWGRRHIESYLLVPAAIRRVLKISADDPRVDQALNDAAGAASDQNSLHAKRILGPGGSLSEAVGAPLRAGEIARAMRREDFHDDVLALFGRIGTLSGATPKGPEVIIRTPVPS